MQKLYCFSRNDFNEYCERRGWDSENYPPDAAFISICNTPGGSDFMFIEEITHYFKTETPEIINLYFDDITEPTAIWNGKVSLTGISQEQADRLCEFIERNQDKDFYIHCEAGLSRSQGVVRYILDVYGEDHDFETLRTNPCRTPNLYVTALLKRAYRKLKNIEI